MRPDLQEERTDGGMAVASIPRLPTSPPQAAAVHLLCVGIAVACTLALPRHNSMAGSQ